jgi:transcription initiation factor IIE alpha subunit
MKRDTTAAENFADVLALLMTRQAFNLTELAERTGHSRGMVRRFLAGMHDRRLIYRKTPGRYGRWAIQPVPGFYPDAPELIENIPGAALAIAWRKAA